MLRAYMFVFGFCFVSLPPTPADHHLVHVLPKSYLHHVEIVRDVLLHVSIFANKSLRVFTMRGFPERGFEGKEGSERKTLSSPSREQKRQ